jgi:D-3-phosphoglycerate dehydrogenase
MTSTNELGTELRRPVILCNMPLTDAGEHERLTTLGDVIVATGSDFDAALPMADALVVIRPATLTAEMVARATRTKVVATVSSGTDHVDTEAIAQRGIRLVAGGGAAPMVVAEWVLWAMLSLRRGFAGISRRLELGELDWATRLAGFQSTELETTTVGVVGFGHIGREVARLLEPTGARVLVYDPLVTSVPAGCELVASVLEICTRADVVTVHVPATDSTRGLIGAAELEALGPYGLIVNAARGGIVDQEALATALETARIAGAALDTFDPEPADGAYIRRLADTERVILTPHVAGVSKGALAALCRTAVNGIALVLE